MRTWPAWRTGIDLSMPLLDLDLSGLHEVGERALDIVMVCLQAWLRRAMPPDSANWLVMNEEASYVLANPGHRSLACGRATRWRQPSGCRSSPSSTG